MQGSQREWVEGPTDAPYDDDYVDLRVSIVHEPAPRSRRGAVLAMLVMVALVLAAFGTATRPLPGPVSPASTAREPMTSERAVEQPPPARPVAPRPG